MQNSIRLFRLENDLGEIETSSNFIASFYLKIMIKSNVSFYAIGEDKVKKYILVQLFIAFLQSSPLPVSLTKTFPVV